MRHRTMRHTASHLMAALLACAFATSAPASSHGGDIPATWDGLNRVEDSRMAAVWIDPEADFSGYERVMLLDAHVAFKKNWERNQRSGASRTRITAREIQKIKEGTATLLHQVFVDELERDGGYEVVDEPGEDVLLVRPAIVDLDIAAPDTSNVGITRSYTNQAGSATLFLELFDSTTGDLLARALDRQSTTNWHVMRRTTSVTNTAEGRRTMRKWAEILRSALDEIHGR